MVSAISDAKTRNQLNSSVFVPNRDGNNRIERLRNIVRDSSAAIHFLIWRGLFGERASHAQKECVWRSMGGTRMTRAELLRCASESRSAKYSPAAQFITAKHT